MIVDFLEGRMGAYVETGLNLIDVRDVALGHILAAEHGRIGEKYILGNRNLTLKQILDCLARIASLPSPRLKLPHWVPLAVAAVNTWTARWRDFASWIVERRDPRVERLFLEIPVPLAVYSSGQDLVQDLLADFGRREICKQSTALIRIANWTCPVFSVCRFG